jgi:dihydrofolate reductase
MGRKTWDSLPERFRPLPGRRNLVLTRQAGWQAPGAETVRSIEDALARCGVSEPLWVIGGGELYAQALPLAREVWVTEIDLHADGDTRAPDLAPWLAAHVVRTEAGEWQRSARSQPADLRYRFVRHLRT